MIADELMIYLLFQMVLLAINVIGYLKIRKLMILGILGSLLMAVPTLLGFGEYYLFSIILILINTLLPTFGILELREND